jgi:phage tail tape-measure protein
LHLKLSGNKKAGINMNESDKGQKDIEQDVKKLELLEAFDRLPPVAKSAAAGAAIGSFVPVIGTGIGAIIGGVAGLAWKWKNS